MVTFAQAQERAEEWINGDVPGYQHREVRVREFELGFVVWAEDRAEGPRSDGGAQRLVIARDSGEATLWPSLPVGEVIRRYEEEYGLPDAAPDPAPAPPARVDLNQTSFLLTPPEWLQEAADRMGIPDRRDRTSGGASGGASGGGSSRPSDGTPDRTSDRASDGAGSRPAAAAAASVSDAVPPGGSAGPAHGGAGGGGAIPETLPGPGGGPGASSAPGGGTSWPAAGGEASGGSGVPADATPWAGTDTNAESGDDRSVPLPATVYAPQIRDVGDGGAGGRPSEPDAAPEAQTRLISGGSQLPSTTVAPALGDPNPLSFPQGQGGPGLRAGLAVPVRRVRPRRVRRLRTAIRRVLAPVRPLRVGPVRRVRRRPGRRPRTATRRVPAPAHRLPVCPVHSLRVRPVRRVRPRTASRRVLRSRPPGPIRRSRLPVQERAGGRCPPTPVTSPTPPPARRRLRRAVPVVRVRPVRRRLRVRPVRPARARVVRLPRPVPVRRGRRRVGTYRRRWSRSSAPTGRAGPGPRSLLERRVPPALRAVRPRAVSTTRRPCSPTRTSPGRPSPLARPVLRVPRSLPAHRVLPARPTTPAARPPVASTTPRPCSPVRRSAAPARPSRRVLRVPPALQVLREVLAGQVPPAPPVASTTPRPCCPVPRPAARARPRRTRGLPVCRRALRACRRRVSSLSPGSPCRDSRCRGSSPRPTATPAGAADRRPRLPGGSALPRPGRERAAAHPAFGAGDPAPGVADPARAARDERAAAAGA